MENESNWPTEKDIEQTNKAKKELHINTRFQLDTNLQYDDIEGIKESRYESKNISKDWVRGMIKYDFDM